MFAHLGLRKHKQNHFERSLDWIQDHSVAMASQFNGVVDKMQATISSPSLECLNTGLPITFVPFLHLVTLLGL
jgi:hypothetical protein